MKDKMMFAGVHISRRYKTKEKELFLSQVIELAKNHGWSTEFQAKHSRFLKICNLVVGDLKKADQIVVCAYDTPQKTVLPGFKYYPFNPTLNAKEETKNLALQLIAAMLCFGVVLMWLKNAISYTGFLKVMAIACCAVFAFQGYKWLRPSGNRVNFSKNSAAVAAMLKLMETVENRKIAFVFLDQNCTSYEGAKLLKEYVQVHQLVLILDNLASGEKTVVAHKNTTDPGSLVKEGWIDKEYDDTANMLSIFTRSIMISCGSIHNKQFIVKNTGTKHDVEVNMDRLVQITEAIKEKLEETK